MESISSCSASRAKSLRGCSPLGTIVARLIRCTLSPDSPLSGRIVAEGGPINAPSPLPRPDRAMRLRLREQFHQRKQQSARSYGIGDLKGGRLQRLNKRMSSGAVPRKGSQELALHFARLWPSLKKKIKKSIDTSSRNFLSHADAPKTDREFYPVNSFCLFGASNQ